MILRPWKKRRTLGGCIALLAAGVAGQTLQGQTFSSGYVYGGATFGKHVDGAGRFGVGMDFRLQRQLDLGGELGTIHKRDVGILASADLSYHLNRDRTPWDPFLVGGVSAARLSGVSGLYVNLGMGVNYWLDHRWGLRGEFRGYPGGQDLGGFAEVRFGVAFRP